MHAQAALRYAASLANRSGSTLSVIYVNDPLLVAAAAVGYDERALAAQSARELAQFITKAVGTRAGGKPIGATVALGQPAAEVLKAARRHEADLIVAGSEGLSGAARLFFGSTTARLLTHTPVPVLAVPSGLMPAKRLTDWPGARMIAAIDLGRHAARDVAVAASIARWFQARLSLVHIVEGVHAPRWLSVNRAAHTRARVTTARLHLERLAGRAGAADFTDVHVLAGDPAELIAALATDLGAGLVLLTLRGSTRLLGDRKGATTYQVVCRASTPVLAVPAGWSVTVSR